MKSLKYQKYLFNSLNKECKFIIFSIFLVAFSTFVFIPYIPIYLHKEFGFLPSQIGLIVFLQFFIQQSGSFASGFLADKYGYYLLFKIAVYLRVAALLGIFLLSYNAFLIILFLMLFSMAGATLTLSQRSLLISKVKSSREKAYAISLNNSLMNFGQGFGILIGGFVYRVNYSISFVVSICIYFAIIAIVNFAIKKTKKEPMVSKPSSFASNRDGILKNKFFLLVIFSQFFYVATWSKLTTYMSLFIESNYNSVIAYSIIMSISLACISLSQMFLGTLVSKNGFKKVICTGYFVVSMGFLLISFVENIYILAGSVVFVSLGVSVVSLQNELQIINSKNIGAVYGVFRLFTGFGVLGVYVAGYIYQFLQSYSLVQYFWSYVSFVALIICFLISFLYRYVSEDEKRFKNNSA